MDAGTYVTIAIVVFTQILALGAALLKYKSIVDLLRAEVEELKKEWDQMYNELEKERERNEKASEQRVLMINQKIDLLSSRFSAELSHIKQLVERK